MKKIFILLMVITLTASLFAGCAKKEEISKEVASADSTTTKEEKASDTSTPSVEPAPSISGDIVVLTHRTDLVDTLFVDYVNEFNKIYPDVNVSFESMTDYEGEVKIRMSTAEYGDVLNIPNIPVDQLPDFFEPLGSYPEMSQKYIFTHEKMYNDTVYGIPTVINASGILYNKKVFAAAGITTLPKSPEEFIAALEKVNSSTTAIPFYTNYAAGWPLGGQYESQMLCIAGNPDWQNTLAHTDAPWSPGQPYYVMSKLLYDIVQKGLIEEDPTTTDWEACKGMIGRGEIATMLLGSWSIIQMQEAADVPSDIGYMPFPYTNADGNIYSAAGGDYSIGININSENKEAARAWVDWFINESGFAQNQTGISAVVGAEMPEVLKGFEDLGVKFVANNPAPTGEEALLDNVDTESEIGRWSENYRKRLLEAAVGNLNESFEDIMTDLNTKWTDARKTLGVN